MIRNWSENVLKIVQPPHGIWPQLPPTKLPPPPSYASMTSNQRPPTFFPNQGQLQVPTVHPNLTPRGRTSSIGNSMKRSRTEMQQNEQSSDINKKKTVVVGTSVANTSGRKLRSPPADIFVWGLHQETTVDDLVKDLSESGIVVEPTGVVKKSKEGAALLSYKISVRAEDLSKALDPSIWPLRVKVKEYIYYPKKKPNNENSDQAIPTQQQSQQTPRIAVQSPNAVSSLPSSFNQLTGIAKTN